MPAVSEAKESRMDAMGSTLLREDGDKPATLTLLALKVIRNAILAGQFKPGDRITER